jgi:hypothetical protein
MDSIQELRNLSSAELVRLGEDSLKQRLHEQAILAHFRHGALTPKNLEIFLSDPECVRYPTRLVFEFGEMAMHQFAQPDLDYRNTSEDGRILYLRPVLRDHPDLTVLAVAYMTPLINYGEVINDEHCLHYGATLLGLMDQEFYDKVCKLADFVGSEPKFPALPGTDCGGSITQGPAYFQENLLPYPT